MDFLNVLAHGVEEIVEVVGPTLDEIIRSNSIKFSAAVGGILLFLTLVSILIGRSSALKQKSEPLKYLFFGLIVLVVLLNSIYLVGSTIYLNQKSQTGGPVHYHADFEIYNCGEKVEVKDPEGLSNKVGTEVVHEHNDDRIHIEGVILDEHQASLGYFFESIGGEIHRDHMAVPTENGLITLQSGMLCNGELVEPQVFVYQTEGKTFYQEKLEDPASYVLSPHSQIPPGDCIIIELDSPKQRTDKLCKFYELAVQKEEILERSRE